MKQKTLVIALVLLVAVIVIGMTLVKSEGFENIPSNNPGAPSGPPDCGDGVTMVAVIKGKENPISFCVLRGRLGTESANPVFTNPNTIQVAVIAPKNFLTRIYDTKGQLITTLPSPQPYGRPDNIWNGPPNIRSIIKDVSPVASKELNPSLSPSENITQTENTVVQPKLQPMLQPIGISSTSQTSAPTLEQCSKFFKCQLTMSPV